MVEDENGNIVRETMKDTDTLARYKTMHETLVYLAHLDHDDTEQQMLDKLRIQVSIQGLSARVAWETSLGQSPFGRHVVSGTITDEHESWHVLV